jgi:hypothetical protein
MRLRNFATAIYFSVTGAFIALCPWSSWWPTASNLPFWLAIPLSAPLIRGLVSGFGLVLIFSAFLETFDGFTPKK